MLDQSRDKYDKIWYWTWFLQDFYSHFQTVKTISICGHENARLHTYNSRDTGIVRIKMLSMGPN